MSEGFSEAIDWRVLIGVLELVGIKLRLIRDNLIEEIVSTFDW